MSSVGSFLSEAFLVIVSKFLEVLKAPGTQPEMLWILVPTLLSMVIILTYTSR